MIETMDVKVTFTWEPAEYAELLEAQARAHPVMRTMRRLALLPLVGAAAVTLAGAALGAPMKEFALIMLPWLLLGGFWAALMSSAMLRLPIWRRPVAGLPEDREFTAEGFRADGPISSALVDWSAVTKIEERSRLLLVQIGRKVHGTPLRVLTPEQRDALAALAAREFTPLPAEGAP